MSRSIDNITSNSVVTVLAFVAFGVFIVWHYKREMAEIKAKQNSK